MENIQFIRKDSKEITLPVFYGKIKEVNPLLIFDGYNALSLEEIAEQRILAWQNVSSDLKLWTKNSFNSGDGIIYHPDGRVKIVPDSETLKRVCKESPFTLASLGSSLILSENSFDNRQGYEFSKSEVEKYAHQFNKSEITINSILENPIWLAIFRENKHLLMEYACQVLLVCYFLIWFCKNDCVGW